MYTSLLDSEVIRSYFSENESIFFHSANPGVFMRWVWGGEGCLFVFHSVWGGEVGSLTGLVPIDLLNNLCLCSLLYVCRTPSLKSVRSQPALFSRRLLLAADRWLLVICNPPVGKGQYPLRAVGKGVGLGPVSPTAVSQTLMVLEIPGGQDLFNTAWFYFSLMFPTVFLALLDWGLIYFSLEKSEMGWRKKKPGRWLAIDLNLLRNPNLTLKGILSLLTLAVTLCMKDRWYWLHCRISLHITFNPLSSCCIYFLPGCFPPTS